MSWARQRVRCAKPRDTTPGRVNDPARRRRAVFRIRPKAKISAEHRLAFSLNASPHRQLSIILPTNPDNSTPLRDGTNSIANLKALTAAAVASPRSTNLGSILLGGGLRASARSFASDVVAGAVAAADVGKAEFSALAGSTPEAGASNIRTSLGVRDVGDIKIRLPGDTR